MIWKTMPDASKPVLLCEGKFLRVYKSGHWEYADRVGATGAVAIVAITEQDHLVLTEQFRIPVGKRVIELPAGLAGDVPGRSAEDLAEAARRELLEETGYQSDEMVCLASGPPSAGLASEIVAFFQAKGLHQVSAGGGEGHEQIQIHEVPIRGIAAWLRRKEEAGVLVDPKIYAGLYLVSVQGPRKT
jgi:ADP-ribose pyrophosphatase